MLQARVESIYETLAKLSLFFNNYQFSLFCNALILKQGFHIVQKNDFKEMPKHTQKTFTT